MQIEHLQIELRPRSHAQALDLGYALLRRHAADVYKAWLALWLPAIALCTLLTWLMPAYGAWWYWLAWWFKPIFERAPLYVLSRRVFGENVTWRQALRAWPRQLKGGSLRLLTWARPFAAGRSLYQPVWQLEMARGKTASTRRALLARDGTGRAAYWFGVVCAHFEAVLQIGLMALIGMFVGGDGDANPFSFLTQALSGDDRQTALLGILGAAVGGAVIGPIYVACGFTLYLNRRARLEAWDIEIALRQIKAPPARREARTGPAVLAMLAGPLALLLALQHPAPAQAAPIADACQPEQGPSGPLAYRSPSHGAGQRALREDVDRVFAHPDLRGYACVDTWRLKTPLADGAPRAKREAPRLHLLAQILQVLFIAAAIGAVGWLLYRYREKFPAFKRKARAAATEVGGLDIRAASLPDDVPAAVRALWAAGERRAALGLLYRATLAQLVEQDALVLHQGATEGDCLRLARQARSRGELGDERLQVTAATTMLWLDGAYGQRWPDSAQLLAQCAAWQSEFGRPGLSP